MKLAHPALPHRTRQVAGFTLIELMIATAVVAILAALAYPSYQNYLRQSRRASVQSLMVNIANIEQQYLLDARNYAVGTNALTTLNIAVPAEVSGYYTVTIGPAAPTTPPSYTITATPIANSVQTPDGALTLDNLGNKTLAGYPGW